MVLFLDTDMLVLEDIAKLFELADDRHTIQLVKNKLRLDLMLFNNTKCRELRPAVIDDMSRDRFGLWWASSSARCLRNGIIASVAMIRAMMQS